MYVISDDFLNERIILTIYGDGHTPGGGILN